MAVTTSNFTIPADGHWHLWLDGVDTGPVLSSSTMITLSLGSHDILAQLQAPDHTPLGPTDMITVTVVSGSSRIYVPFMVKGD